MSGQTWLNVIIIIGVVVWLLELILLYREAIEENADPIDVVSGAAIFFVLALPVARRAPDLVDRLADFWARLLGGDHARQLESLPRLVIDGKNIPLKAERIRLGRFQNNDVVLDHPTVSAYHAEIMLRPDGRHEITDRDSRNGTRINGTPIRSAILRDGDLVTIGAVSFHYRIRPMGERQMAASAPGPRRRLS